jgi:hypothetical protein
LSNSAVPKPKPVGSRKTGTTRLKPETVVFSGQVTWRLGSVTVKGHHATALTHLEVDGVSEEHL